MSEYVMRQFDRPAKSARFAFDRSSDPATLVCFALALAMIALSARIVSVW